MHNWTIENFTIVGLAGLKMLSFFWPVLLVIAYFMYVEWRKEREERMRTLLMQPQKVVICSKGLKRRKNPQNLWK